jgi:hypothetical protein
MTPLLADSSHAANGPNSTPRAREGMRSAISGFAEEIEKLVGRFAVKGKGLAQIAEKIFVMGEYRSKTHSLRGDAVVLDN